MPNLEKICTNKTEQVHKAATDNLNKVIEHKRCPYWVEQSVHLSQYCLCQILIGVSDWDFPSSVVVLGTKAGTSQCKWGALPWSYNGSYTIRDKIRMQNWPTTHFQVKLQATAAQYSHVTNLVTCLRSCIYSKAEVKILCSTASLHAAIFWQVYFPASQGMCAPISCDLATLDSFDISELTSIPTTG